MNRRDFLKSGGKLAFTAIALSSLPMAALLTGCESEVFRVTYINWSQDIKKYNVLAMKVRAEKDLEDIALWVKSNNYRMKAFGSMHNWSPLIISEDEVDSDLMLLDLSELNSLEMLEANPDYGVVSVGAGCMAESLYDFLEKQKDPINGCPDGYAFSNTPAPGDLSVGGMLAIGGHGTKVKYKGSTENEDFNGCISNSVLSLTALVWDGFAYKLKTFTRTDPDCDLFLTSLGSIIITKVSFKVLPGYYLRCQSFTNIHYKDMFTESANNSIHALSNILDKHGRLEVIWFPNTEYPWLKVWSNEPTKPISSRPVLTAYNYPFSDNIPLEISEIIKDYLVRNPKSVPSFGQTQLSITKNALEGSANLENIFKGACKLASSTEQPLSKTDLNPFKSFIEHSSSQTNILPSLTQSHDLWGPAWKMLVYVRKNTLRVTANGYAVLLPREDIQSFLAKFTQKYLTLESSYKERDLYPTAGPMEIRVTEVDNTEGLPSGSRPPALSATTASKNKKLDTVIWLDLLSFSKMKGMAEFFTEIEQWLYKQLPADQIRVEWSKGWAYNKKGAWQNADFIENTLPKTFSNASRSLSETSLALKKYDPYSILRSKILNDVLKN